MYSLEGRGDYRSHIGRHNIQSAPDPKVTQMLGWVGTEQIFRVQPVQ